MPTSGSPMMAAGSAVRARMLQPDPALGCTVTLGLSSQQLVLETLLSFSRLASTADEFEFTLKQVLEILARSLNCDCAAFVDFRDESVYGVVRGTPSTRIAPELTEEAHSMARMRSGTPATIKNTVLWNRRVLAGEAPLTGEWLAIPSVQGSEAVGGYLLHSPEPVKNEAEMLSLCAAADQCLVMPRLMLRMQELTDETESRYNALQEMIGLFREIDDPDFGLRYLLILLECSRVDRGILWECDVQGAVSRTHPIGLSLELAEHLSLNGTESLVEQVVATGTVYVDEPLILGTHGPNPDAPKPLQTQVCKSALGFPLIGAEGIVGVVALLDLDYTALGGAKFIRMMSSLGASYLENTARHRRLVTARELDLQVQMAREIQQSMMPSDVALPPGIEVAATSLSAQQVSGDFHHLARFGAGLRVTIGDVSGKSVGAGMLMSTTLALIHLAIELDWDGSVMFEHINNTLVERTPSDKFVSAFHCCLNTATGALRCWNAGHDPMIRVRPDGTLERIDAEGMLLGIIPDVRYPAVRVQLEPGDLLVLFTDGIPEAMNEHREMLGFDAIDACLTKHAGQSAQEVADALLHLQQTFANGEPQHDDTTIVVLRVLAPGESFDSTEASYP